ncbi:MAG TPA: glycerophosphodiester phosphodiesterase family protein [Candidatus Methylomirabilis sp.]|nr:glycerophosphodiester phosphodiesterase family protein [Candidatus Methylomirabilis sp.]
MRRTITGAVVAAAVVAGSLLRPAVAGAPAGPTTETVATCIRDSRCHRIFVVAHRANGFGAPENSRAAVFHAIQAGVPLIKIDVRASKDGDLYVLHDGWLDRTTNLRGRIEGFTSVQLAQARLANGEPLPRFQDLYEIARGRTVLTVGFKVDVVEQIADWIARHGSFDDMIFFVNTGEQMQAAARAKRQYPRMLVMVRLLDTRVTVDSTRAVFGGRLPEIFHTERVRAAAVADLHALGVKVFMNVVQWEGYLQPVKYLAIGWVLGTKLDFVLTDEPAPMMRRVAGRNVSDARRVPR